VLALGARPYFDLVREISSSFNTYAMREARSVKKAGVLGKTAK